MQIVFQGSHSADEAAEGLMSVLRLFSDRYGVDNFRDMRLDLVLLDQEGDDVELVDPQTAEAYRTFEVYKAEDYPQQQTAPLRLVVDNTK